MNWTYMPEPTNRDIMSKLDMLDTAITTRLTALETRMINLTAKVDEIDTRLERVETDVRDMRTTLSYLHNSHIQHVMDSDRHT
jgi:archaellum component FlaC